jgi:hypothetical protein
MQYAVKKMNRKELQRQVVNGQNLYDCVKVELELLATLEHPNIIWLHEFIDEPKKDHIYLVTDWLK